MKKNTMMKIASVLMIAVLLTTCVISGTFAKYTSEAAGDDTARVAKWSFTVEGADIATTNSFTFDLFNTANYTDSAVDTKDATVIAPGTTGWFQVDVANASEVAANYAVVFADDNQNNIPIEYSLDNTTWKSDITALNFNKDLLFANDTHSDEDFFRVYWRWAFNGGESTNFTTTQTDTTDTDLGINGTFTVKVTATITATQLNEYSVAP